MQLPTCLPRKPRSLPGDAFLLAHDRNFRSAVEALYQEVRSRSLSCPGGVRDAFADRVRERLRPFNHAGLCDPNRRNMYPHAVRNRRFDGMSPVLTPVASSAQIRDRIP